MPIPTVCPSEKFVRTWVVTRGWAVVKVVLVLRRSPESLVPTAVSVYFLPKPSFSPATHSDAPEVSAPSTLVPSAPTSITFSMVPCSAETVGSRPGSTLFSCSSGCRCSTTGSGSAGCLERPARRRSPSPEAVPHEPSRSTQATDTTTQRALQRVPRPGRAAIKPSIPYQFSPARHSTVCPTTTQTPIDVIKPMSPVHPVANSGAVWNPADSVVLIFLSLTGKETADCPATPSAISSSGRATGS